MASSSEILASLPTDRAIFRMEHYANLYPATPALISAAVGSLDSALDDSSGSHNSTRGRLGALATFGTVASLIAACGATPPAPTENPTQVPVTPSPYETTSPMPTPLETPTEIPTPTGTILVTLPPTETPPTPTASPTPSPRDTVPPTPEATPTTISGIVDDTVKAAEQNGGYENISSKNTQQGFEDAYAADPTAANTPTRSGGTYLTDSRTLFKYCSTGKDPNPGDPKFNRYSDCFSLIQTLWSAYKIDHEQKFVDAIIDMINFAENNLDSSYHQQLLDDVRSLQ